MFPLGPAYSRIPISFLFLRLVGLLFLGPCTALFIQAILGILTGVGSLVLFVTLFTPVPAQGLA